jgi:hypothetical protein
MQRYLIQLSIAVAFISAAVVCLVYLVDPYDYWGHQRLRRLTAAKPEAAKHLSEIKGRQYLRIKPQVLIVGNSRVAVGLDPAAYKAKLSKTVYNFGLPGSYISATLTQVAGLLASHKPEKILIDLDYTDFPVLANDWASDNPNIPHLTHTPQDRLKLYTQTNFSLSAWVDMIATVSESQKSIPRTVRPDGYFGMEWIADSIASEGAQAVFDMKQRAEQPILVRKFSGKHIKWPVAGQNAFAKALDSFVVLSQKQNIEVVLFVSPVHEHLAASHEKLGIASEKASFRLIMREIAARRGVKLFDFDGKSKFQREVIPAPSAPGQSMRWYWEGSHYKPALGNVLLACMDAPLALQDQSCTSLDAKIYLP